jgi:hypothetical protein
VAVRWPRQRHPVTTDSRHRHAVAPNLLARQVDVAQPDQYGREIHLSLDGRRLVISGGAAGLVLSESRRVGAESSCRCRLGTGGVAQGTGV